MTTPEQQARLVSVTETDANNYCRVLTVLGCEEEGDPVDEIANLIAERDALKAEQQALWESAEPYCYVYEWDTEFGLVQNTRPANFNGKIFDRVVPLYTRLAVPLTDTLASDSQPMADAPLDGTLVRLLVKFDNHAIEDTNEPTWTIGSHNDGEWNFVGWCWHTDEWTRGSGNLLGWLPMRRDYEKCHIKGAKT